MRYCMNSMFSTERVGEFEAGLSGNPRSYVLFFSRLLWQEKKFSKINCSSPRRRRPNNAVWELIYLTRHLNLKSEFL